MAELQSGSPGHGVPLAQTYYGLNSIQVFGVTVAPSAMVGISLVQM